MMTPFSSLQKDIEDAGISLSTSKLKTCLGNYSERAFDPKEIVSRRRIEGDFPISSEYILYLTSGVTAAEITGSNGQRVIPRFHEAGDISAPLPKLTSRVDESETMIGEENAIIAITPAEGVLIPLENWHREFLEGNVFGTFVRHKMFQGYRFTSAVSHIKSLNRTADSYDFLRTYQPNVLKSVPQKIIAQFIGITPEALSRFLKSNTHA
ncbi:MAG: hypothetical protein AAGF33_01985 [Pseudomonadota bacterium]